MHVETGNKREEASGGAHTRLHSVFEARQLVQVLLLMQWQPNRPVWPVLEEVFTVYQAVFGDLVMHVDGVRRAMVSWPDWLVTTRIHTLDYWRTAVRAIACHRTQVPAYHVLEHLSEGQREVLWGTQSYYRVISLVNGGRQVENDMFEGLR
jgi:hypothetical protein